MWSIPQRISQDAACRGSIAVHKRVVSYEKIFVRCPKSRRVTIVALLHQMEDKDGI
jgi:hypothetical protein